MRLNNGKHILRTSAWLGRANDYYATADFSNVEKAANDEKAPDEKEDRAEESDPAKSNSRAFPDDDWA